MDETRRWIVWFQVGDVIELVCAVHGKVTRIKSEDSPLTDDQCLMCVLDKAQNEPREP